MLTLIAGLIVFLGAHSVRIFADDWRTRQLAKLGEKPWRSIHSVISIVGFVLIVWGYGATRAAPVALWEPPVWTRHLAALLTLGAFVLIAAAYVPGTRIKAAFGYPVALGIKLWAVAHLAANGRLGDVVLFGAFLAWAVLDFCAARRRDRAAGRSYPPARGFTRDAVAVALGVAAWGVFAFHLHAWLIGVRPFA